MHLLELVPRDITQLQTEAKQLLVQYPLLSGINIPDVMRLSVRSLDAAEALLAIAPFVVPHIRSVDCDVEGHIDRLRPLVNKGLKAVLVVSGDPYKDLPSYDVTPPALISALKSEFSVLQVYAALDPYRQSFTKELIYCEQKQKAGADGFFTQPFFDADLAKLYLDQLDTTTVFLGISPVTTEKSKHYWEDKNNVTFPSSFELSLSANAKVANKLIALAEDYHQHIYMMPIRVDAATYLAEVY